VPSIVPHLKKELVSAPITQPPDWHLPFQIKCDTSDYALGAMLGQSKDNKHYAISYASKTLSGPQLNYTTMEMEVLAMCFSTKSLDHIWWAQRLLSIQIMLLSSIS
jgi:hypothetical protein